MYIYIYIYLFIYTYRDTHTPPGPVLPRDPAGQLHGEERVRHPPRVSLFIFVCVVFVCLLAYSLLFLNIYCYLCSFDTFIICFTAASRISGARLRRPCRVLGEPKALNRQLPDGIGTSGAIAEVPAMYSQRAIQAWSWVGVAAPPLQVLMCRSYHIK